MRDPAILVLHLLATVARLASPGSVGSLFAGSGLVKHQLLIHSRSRQRSPNLRFSDRLVAGPAGRSVTGLADAAGNAALAPRRFAIQEVATSG